MLDGGGATAGVDAWTGLAAASEARAGTGLALVAAGGDGAAPGEALGSAASGEAGATAGTAIGAAELQALKLSSARAAAARARFFMTSSAERLVKSCLSPT